MEKAVHEILLHLHRRHFAFLLCVRFDVFGIERQVPTASDVFEVDMTMGETTYALTDADEIADFISMHKEIVNEKKNF